jgi:hypothetical protein
MLKNRLASYAFAFALAFANFDPALALPVSAHDIGASAPAPQLELVRGGRGGGHRGGGGYHRGAGVAHRGYGVRGGGMRAGYGARAGYRAGARGAYRVGGRYYGGRWYGTGRRWYGGRWWAYGVGSCWRSSPIGYVWICG